LLHLKRLVGGLTAELLGLAVGWDSEAVGFDGELYGQGVYQLEIATAGGTVANQTDAYAMFKFGGNLDVGAHVLVATIYREHALNMVGRGGADFGVREVDHVGIPVVVLILGQHRGVAGHLYHVAIALNIGEIEGFGQCGLDIGTLDIG
jgi:hypothetical protein